ncbi:hypothetical protein GCK72_000404 [Caenorhabditis remanei]|uniref:NR LBD domain-containing protein n=1 Tax=Caenorhabditis remanei TaxID=31234 RepID=A0A6A5HS49_CAERE|nr:hypothetical protein GCK72_000404 [Caenorhabditis remanei]KAF1768592.1 hypothetical protein GCK72_000404 [Caenorhabditis remanei]
MFFRRAIDTNKPIICKKEGKCDFRQVKCRFCRFHQCIRIGMKCLLVSDDPTKTILSLLEKNATRQKHFLEAMVPTNLSVEDIFTRGALDFEAKPADSKYGFYDWAVINQLTCIDFATKFDFMKYLSAVDIKAMLKYSHLMYVILVTAMRSYRSKKAVMCHPDGTDIFPEEVHKITCYNDHFLNEIRCSLIGRIIELNVTEEEFVLLSAILLCNPAVPHLSQSGQILLSTHQEMFSTALLHYCVLENSTGGPTRFNEILSLTHVISKTQKDIDYFSSLFPIVQPQDVKSNLFTDILSFLLR